MAVVAVARVGYQKGEDPNDVVWFEPGDEVKGSIPKEVMETWKANGTVGEPAPLLPSVVAEKEALEARVAELEAQLAAAKDEGNKPAPKPPAPTPAKP